MKTPKLLFKGGDIQNIEELVTLDEEEILRLYKAKCVDLVILETDD